MTYLSWLAQWEAAINARDYAAGRALFAPEVTAFGTYSEKMHGIDQLVALQWREMWPFISNFRFASDDAEVLESADGSLQVLSLLWTSDGLRPDGAIFSRRGRATLVLRREGDASLRAVHTHFSMSEGHASRHEKLQDRPPPSP